MKRFAPGRLTLIVPRAGITLTFSWRTGGGSWLPESALSLATTVQVLFWFSPSATSPVGEQSPPT